MNPLGLVFVFGTGCLLGALALAAAAGSSRPTPTQAMDSPVASHLAHGVIVLGRALAQVICERDEAIARADALDAELASMKAGLEWFKEGR